MVCCTLNKEKLRDLTRFTSGYFFKSYISFLIFFFFFFFFFFFNFISFHFFRTITCINSQVPVLDPPCILLTTWWLNWWKTARNLTITSFPQVAPSRFFLCPLFPEGEENETILRGRSTSGSPQKEVDSTQTSERDHQAVSLYKNIPPWCSVGNCGGRMENRSPLGDYSPRPNHWHVAMPEHKGN